MAEAICGECGESFGNAGGLGSHRKFAHGVEPPSCSVGGCGGAHSSHGFCSKHANAWRRYGDPLENRESRLGIGSTTCGEHTFRYQGECEDCVQAYRAYMRRWKELRAGQLAPDDPRHGTVTGYMAWSCRCEDCREAWGEYHRPYRYQRRMLEEGADSEPYTLEGGWGARQVAMWAVRGTCGPQLRLASSSVCDHRPHRPVE